MIDFMSEMETAGKAEETLKWEGTFREFLKLVKSGKCPNAGDLAHQRIYKMIVAAGTEKVDHYGIERTRFNFFEDHLYGIEDTIDSLMTYIRSASQRTETSRRMLLLFGPPSSGKSDITTLLKHGLEAYSRTDEGAVFAIKGSKMHENPFLLVPEVSVINGKTVRLRDRFQEEFGISIEGQLSPIAKYRLDHEFKGDFMEFPVERIIFSEANRVGIGTWLPSDEKGQDLAELVGGIDMARIQEFGEESDPRSYNFDGEINVANRGIMEYIEGLKASEKFLRTNLTVSQEKLIKAPRFGLIYVDCFLLLHSNETEFINFMHEKKYEAYHDRMYLVKAGYNLAVANEIKIYEKLLKQSDAMIDIHISPHTLEVAAIFAVLSRLEHADSENLLKKMKLYNKENVRGRKLTEVPMLKKKSPREGMEGISPRFVIDQICAAISRARDESKNFVIPLDILRQINDGVFKRDTFTKEEKQRYEENVGIARDELNTAIRNDIQKAFFLTFDDEARALCETYLDHVEAYLENKKPRDPVTGEEIELNHKLIDSIEEQIGISDSGRNDFRHEIMLGVASASRSGKKFDYSEHSLLKEAIQKQLFHERRGVIQMTVSSRNPDPEGLKRINGVVDRMVEQQGYTAESANAILKYASSHLFEKS